MPEGATPSAEGAPPAEAVPASFEAAISPGESPPGYEGAPHVVGQTVTDRPTLIIRYGGMGILGRFVHSLDHWICGQRVLIKSDRGMEIGNIVCKWAGCGQPGGVPPQVRGEVLRQVTHADEVEERHLREGERREFTYAKECIAARSLPMKLVAVEHLFGGDRIVFYFVSESRVDFRALVRDLAHEFQTRIEMRQIGVRDEARLLGDYEKCGRPLCCRAWIKELEPVSMKMAKVQKATLDPTKISGRCGRLMCCLRFEHETYRELSRKLPRKNTLVTSTEGPAKVLDTDVVSQTVRLLLMNGNQIVVPIESLLAPGAAPPVPAPGAGGEGAEADVESRVASDAGRPVAARPPRPPRSEEPPPEQPDESQEAPPEIEPAAAAPDEQGSARPAQGAARSPQRGERSPRGGGRSPRGGGRSSRGGDRSQRGGGRSSRGGERAPQGGSRPPQGAEQPPQAAEVAPQGGERPPQAGERPPQGAEQAPPQGGERAPQAGERAPQAGQGGTGGQGGPGAADGQERRGRRRRSRRGGRNRGRREGGPGGQGGQGGPGGQGGTPLRGPAPGGAPSSGPAPQAPPSSPPQSQPPAGPPGTTQGS